MTTTDLCDIIETVIPNCRSMPVNWIAAELKRQGLRVEAKLELAFKGKQ
jgi:hypothetical protein